MVKIMIVKLIIFENVPFVLCMQSFGNPYPPKLKIQYTHGIYCFPKCIFCEFMVLSIHCFKSNFNQCPSFEGEIIKKVIFFLFYEFCFLYIRQLINDRCVCEFHLKHLFFQSYFPRI